MFRNYNPPTPTTLAYRKRFRKARPKPISIPQRDAHLYVGVSRQAVSARVRAGKLSPELRDGYRYSRSSRLKVADLDLWIARREAHLARNRRRRQRAR